MDCYDQAVHLRWQSIYREVDTTMAHTARSSPAAAQIRAATGTPTLNLITAAYRCVIRRVIAKRLMWRVKVVIGARINLQLDLSAARRHALQKFLAGGKWRPDIGGAGQD